MRRIAHLGTKTKSSAIICVGSAFICEPLLLLKSQTPHDLVVFLFVAFLQVLQVRTAVCNHLKQSAAGVFVLVMALKMRREFVDLLR